MSVALLQVEHLTKHFILGGDIVSRMAGRRRTLKAVDDISFSIREGETLGLVGESGCGKSTTGRLITRLIEPSGGAIRLSGEDMLAVQPQADARAPVSRFSLSSRIPTPR